MFTLKQIWLPLLVCVFVFNALSFSDSKTPLSQDDWELDVSSSVPVYIAWQGPRDKGLEIVAYMEKRDYNLDNLKKVYAALSKRQKDYFYIGIEIFTTKEKAKEEAHYKKNNILPLEAYYDYDPKDPRNKELMSQPTPEINWYSSDYFNSKYEEWIIFYDPDKKDSERIVLRKAPVKVTLLSELQGAIEKGDISKIQKLLDSGVSVNARENDNYGTPLMWAIEDNQLSVGEFLISKGADINLGTNIGSTPLIKASSWGNLDFVKLLIRSGAKIDLTDEYERTPLYHAACDGQYDVVVYLTKWGADVNKANKEGETPLICASGQGIDEDTTQADRQRMYKIISHLIKSGADVNLRNKDGETALSKAWDEKIAKILLKAGAKK